MPFGRATQTDPKTATDRQTEGCGLCADARIKKSALETIYNSAHKLDREAHARLAERASGEEAPHIGRELEEAAAARLLRWLNQPTNDAYRRIVQSVWRNVRVRRQGAAEIAAELDIAVLLKNGILLHLSVDLLPRLRGQELTAVEMRACAARIEEYRIQRVAWR